MKAVHWLYWNSLTWSSSDVNVKLKRGHHVMSHLSVFRIFWEPFFKQYFAVFYGEQEKESIIRVRMG